MKRPAALAAFAALAVALAAAVAPASAARSSYVIDDAHLLSAAAVSQIDGQVGTLVSQTGKEVLVVTTASLNGVAADTAIEKSFSQQAVNGVEIYIAKDDHVIRIAGDRASSQFFPSGSYQTIAQSMRASFRAGDYDGGVENAVSEIVNTYRGHESSLGSNARRPVPTTYARRSYGGPSLGWIWWLIILAVIFFIIRGIFRALAGPRMYGPGPGYGGPGYGGPGYGGPGYGYGGGGGGFWSGLLGGLGGAWLGNELFGNRGGFGGGYVDPGSGPVDGGNAADAGGWQSDAGQIDSSNIGGASWGDSGGGWGGGDSGGGGWGGGDSGGGGGSDSGGGW